MIITQLGLGINIFYENATVKGEKGVSSKLLFICVLQAHVLLATHFPQINLDPFIFCFGESMRADGHAFYILGIGFGKPLQLPISNAL